MNWLHYLVEANLYLAVFYTVYYLFLSNDTHYTLNRAYLLLSCIVSFIIPVIQLGFLKPAPQTAVIQYVNYHGVMVKPIEVTLIPPPEKFNWQDGIFYIYLAGAAILLLVLIFKLYQLVRIISKSNKPANASYKLISLNDSNTAFSFFNFLFIGTKAEGRETIIKHELVHISQKHSVDIVFIEVLKIINWFNPFIYIVQHSLKAIHEYIADEQTAATEIDALTYSSFLVHNAYGLSGSSITHSFFNYNLLKKRIIMLNQKRSGSLARLKYLLAVPICAGLLCASTLAFSKNYGWVDLAPRHTQPTANAIKADLDAKGVDANPQAEGYTNKGYKYKLNKYITGNAINFMVVIYEKDGSKLHYVKSAATPADLKLLSQKYGFIFPPNGKYKLVTPVDTFKFIAPVVKKDSLKTTNHKLPPPPPPSAVKHITDVRLLPPPPNDKNVRFAAPTSPSEVTKKGYKYAEAGYLVNGKTDFKVTIVEKDGTQTSYFKSSSSAKQIKMLRDKYGYSFPNISIYSKLPPPPPAPLAPPIKEAPKASIDERPSPSPSTSELKPATTIKSGKAIVVSIDTEAFNNSNLRDQTPVIVVNGSIYKLKEPLRKGQKLTVRADSTIAYVYSGDDLNKIVQKYGLAAQNGVIYAFGKTLVSVK